LDILDVDPSAALPRVAQVVERAALLEYQAHVRALPAADAVKGLVVDLVCRTRPEAVPAKFKPYVRLGVSPRGAQALLMASRARAAMAGRLHVTAEDVRASAPLALRHRVLLGFAARADGVTADDVVAAVLAAG
jgi:MoxR-like ATPase